MKSEIYEQLEKLAYKRSIPFCYNDYIECPTGRCHKCGSDDLMRLLPSIGCEYGTEWIIKSILETELTPVDLDDEFEEFVRQCYPEEVSCGWMSFDCVQIMKELDPISWQCAQSEWESQEADEENIISFDGGSTYYRSSDVVELLRKD